jgi:hypothetical protein
MDARYYGLRRNDAMAFLLAFETAFKISFLFKENQLQKKLHGFLK